MDSRVKPERGEGVIILVIRKRKGTISVIFQQLSEPMVGLHGGNHQHGSYENREGAVGRGKGHNHASLLAPLGWLFSLHGMVSSCL